MAVEISYVVIIIVIIIIIIIIIIVIIASTENSGQNSAMSSLRTYKRLRFSLNVFISSRL